MPRPKGIAKTGGRKAGTPNKVTAELKDAVLQAAEEAGGEQGTVGYLKAVAVSNPQAFCALLGKVLPLTVQGTGKSGALLLGWIPRE